MLNVKSFQIENFIPADYQDAACHVEDCGTDAAGGGEERTLLVYNLKRSLI